mmetsp:Transcript_128824/g.222612  ORF Transcript_128824/g.222612 Transcript_128824/m.222612 type:complete len:312 (-) Transcript_128824:253-1188(-)
MPSSTSRGRPTQRFSASRTSGVMRPNRTSFRMRTKCSSACRYTLLRCTTANCNFSHTLLWNTNFACWFLFTGGSCSRSPLRTSWSPPNGLPAPAFDPRTVDATSSSLSSMSALTMEISSMIRVRHARQYFRCRSDRMILSIHELASPSPKPIPANEWRVMPPTSTAEIPVDAVTKVEFGSVNLTISLIRYVFPVPAQPVKKTLRPSLMWRSTESCSSDRLVSCCRYASCTARLEAGWYNSSPSSTSSSPLWSSSFNPTPLVPRRPLRLSFFTRDTCPTLASSLRFRRTRWSSKSCGMSSSVAICSCTRLPR